MDSTIKMKQASRPWVMDLLNLESNNKLVEEYVKIIQSYIEQANGIAKDSQLLDYLIRQINCQCGQHEEELKQAEHQIFEFCCGANCGLLLCQNCTKEDRISTNGLTYICEHCVEVEQQDIQETLWIDNEPGNESTPDYADKTPPPDHNLILCADTVGCSVRNKWSMCICGTGRGRRRGGYYNNE